MKTTKDIKYLAQCLAHSKHSVKVSFCFYHDLKDGIYDKYMTNQIIGKAAR